MKPGSAAFVAAVLLTAFLPSPAAAEPEAYELHVGETKVDLVVDEPFRIELPGGVGLDAVLVKPPHRWRGRVLSFDYPREYPWDYEVQTHRPEGLLGWNVWGRDGIIVRILAYAPGQSDPKKALAVAMRTLKEELGTGTEVEKEAIRREIAGEMRTGRRLVAMIGDDPAREEVFAFRLGDRVLVVSFRWQEPTRERHAPAQAMVASTLARAEAGAKPAPEPRYPPKFELRVGERTYGVDVDRRFKLETGEGKTQIAVLRRPPQTFRGHGLTFRYPGDGSASATNPPGRAMIEVSFGLYYSVSLQYYLIEGVTTDAAQTLSVKHIKESVEKRGVKFGPDETCRFRIAGRSRTGTRLRFAGEADPYLVELYSFKVGGRTLTVLFFCRESDEKTARAKFKMIADSLKKE